MTIPVIDLGCWGPTEASLYAFFEQEEVGRFIIDPDTQQEVWQWLPPYAGNVAITHSWGGVVLTGNKHPSGPSTDPDNPRYVEGYHSNMRMFGQELLELLAGNLEQYEVIGQDPDTGEDILQPREVWSRTDLAGNSWWRLNQFPQGIPGLGYPPGWGKPPGQQGVMFSDYGYGRFSSPANRWQ